MEISDIQRRMAQIRLEMHQDIRGAVQGAQSLTDWRSLVRNHPWIALGGAAAAGYLIVPRRERKAPAVVLPMSTAAEAPPLARRSQPVEARRSEVGSFGTILSLVAPVAIRAAQNYLLKRFEQWLEKHPLHPAGNSDRRRNDTASGPAAGGRATFPSNR
jgi:hypothetical protein